MEGGLEKLQNLEDAMIKTKDEKSVEERGKAPVFTVPFSNLDSLREGENAHFEARLIPTDDPNLKVIIMIPNIILFYLQKKYLLNKHISRSNGSGMASLLRLDRDSAPSVISVLSSWKYLPSTQKTLVNILVVHSINSAKQLQRHR